MDTENGQTSGCTIVLDSPEAESPWRETPLPFADNPYRAEREAVPQRIRAMRRLYEYGRESPLSRARNFVRQARFMADYEDEAAWEGDFVCFFPSYHDLNLRQLRGYFGWRTRLRRGEVGPIPSSAAYLYVYELLNGVGVASPEESLAKLREFERLFLDSGVGDEGMRYNLRRWMLELAVVKDLPPALAREAASEELRTWDGALLALRSPDEHTDEEVFAALRLLVGKKAEKSPVPERDPARAAQLFARCWRTACAYGPEGAELFSRCFGEMVTRRWYPLSNAVYYEEAAPGRREYELSPIRRFRCRNGLWQIECYEKLNMDRGRLQSFWHAADSRLRRYLKAGHPLRESPEDAWAAPIVDAVIEMDRRAAREAARPRLRIDLTGLEQIRSDAALTRERLLTEEERSEAAQIAGTGVPTENPAPETPAPEAVPVPADLPLAPLQAELLRALLAGRDPGPMLRERRLLPSVLADEINAALLDEIGDSVLLCEEDRLCLVEDYIEDLQHLLGGSGHGGT